MTTTPQAALLSDGEIIAIRKSAKPTDPAKAWGDTIALARGIEAAILAKLKATQEPVQAGELPDEREAFEQWWRQRQLLTFPKDYDQSRLADWGDAYKPAAKDAWQARAALSARKPLTDETFVAACNGCPTPGKCKDTSGCASAGMNVPTYYVRHPDDTYTAADPQPRFNAHRPGGEAVSKGYETRVTSWTVAPKGEPTFSEMATVVSIDDEAAGEYVVVSQQGRVDLGKIAIDPGEWPALRAAIDEAISECRSAAMSAALQSGDRG